MDREFAYSFMEYQTSGNKWTDLEPMTKLAVCMSVGLSCIIIRDWRYGFTLCALYLLAALYIGIFKKFAKLFFTTSILLVLLTLVIRQLTEASTAKEEMFSLFGWVWHREPFIHALDIISYIMGFTGALLIFFNSTEMRDIMYSLERRGVTHVASYIMLSSMQSIIDMKKSAETILESQKSRGIETDGNIAVRMKAFFPILGPILLGAMSGTEEKSIAMDARAFSAEGEHTYLRELKPAGTADRILLVLSALYFVGCIVYRVLHARGIV